MRKVVRRVNGVGVKEIEYDGMRMVDDGQTDEEIVRHRETRRREAREWLDWWRKRVDTEFDGDVDAARAAADRDPLGQRMTEEQRTSNAIRRDQREDAVRRALKSPQ